MLAEHAHHRGDALFDRAGAALDLDHRRIQPDRVAERGLDALVALGAFADDGRRGDVARLERVHECLALGVDEHRADGADFFGDERAVDLRGESRAGRMVLERVLIEELRARAVAEDESVGGRAVVVRGGEALIVEPARAAGRQNDDLRLRDHQLLRLHVQKNCAGAVAVLILEQLDGGREVDDLDAAVEHFIAQRAHDLRAGIVLGRVHALAGRAAAVRRDHRAVGGLVKFHAEVREPLDGLRRLGDELVEQILLRGKMAAAIGVEEVLRGGVVRLVRRLNAALGHHRVRVAHAELRHEQDLCARIVSLDGRGAARAAAADDEHVGLIVGLRQVDVAARKAGLALEQGAQLQWDFFALVRADVERGELVVAIVGVEGLEQNVFLLRRHAAGIELDVFRAGGLCLLDGFLQCFVLIHTARLLTLRCRGCCKAPEFRSGACP